jgi:hypothetical protein
MQSDRAIVIARRPKDQAANAFTRNSRAFCQIKCRIGPKLQGKLARLDKSSTVYAIGVDGGMSVLAARASSKKEALPPARSSACFRHGKGEVHADQFS